MIGSEVDDLTDEADLVVSGTVEKFQTCRSDGPVTFVTIAPDAVWKVGAAPAGLLTVEVPGGYIDGHHLAAGISPEFEVGERAVVFLSMHEEGVARPSAGFQGKFSVHRDGTLDRTGVHVDALRAAVSEAASGKLPDHRDPLAGGAEIIESAYTTIGPKFADASIPVAININPNNNRPSQLTAQEARLASINAFHTWQNISGSYITFGPVSDTTRTSTQGDCDQKFDTTFGIAGSHNANTLAVAWTCYNGSGILDVDVEIDTNHFGPNWSVDGGGACGSGEFDLETVLLHENGHFLGLGHPGNLGCVPCPVMDASYGGVQRNTCTDDTNGANALYPLAAGSPPAVPLGFTALGTTWITLNWLDVASEWGYEIWRAPGLCAFVAAGDFKLVDTVPDGTLVYNDKDYNNGIPAGQSFCYKLRSFNKTGTSAFSLTADGIVMLGGTPIASPTPPTSPSPTVSPPPTSTPSPTPTPRFPDSDHPARRRPSHPRHRTVVHADTRRQPATCANRNTTPAGDTRRRQLRPREDPGRLTRHPADRGTTRASRRVSRERRLRWQRPGAGGGRRGASLGHRRRG